MDVKMPLGFRSLAAVLASPVIARQYGYTQSLPSWSIREQFGRGVAPSRATRPCQPLDFIRARQRAVPLGRTVRMIRRAATDTHALAGSTYIAPSRAPGAGCRAVSLSSPDLIELLVASGALRWRPLCKPCFRTASAAARQRACRLPFVASLERLSADGADAPEPFPVLLTRQLLTARKRTAAVTGSYREKRFIADDTLFCARHRGIVSYV
jgi:hypothetical protein